MAVSLEVNQRLNPYRQAGLVYYSGLDYIITNIGTEPDASASATNYIAANYSSSVPYIKQAIDPISVRGLNFTINANDTLQGVEFNGYYNSMVQEVFSFVQNFPPLISQNSVVKSGVIFTDYYGQWDLNYTELLNTILDSGLSPDQMVLPLVGHSVLGAAYGYWQAAYTNDGGSNAWYTYITGIVGSIDDLDWRLLILQSLKGAFQGAVDGAIANPTDVNGGLLIGAAAAAMSAAGCNVQLQTTLISQYDPA